MGKESQGQKKRARLYFGLLPSGSLLIILLENSILLKKKKIPHQDEELSRHIETALLHCPPSYYANRNKERKLKASFYAR